MSETTFDWDDLKLFLAVARTGGLSAASAVTGKSAPTLGRRMLALEAITGSELFVRLARGYELTEQGTALLNKVVDLEAQILPLDRSADTHANILVKVSAGSWMTHILCQNIHHILEDNASTRLRFISAEHVLSIAHRETVIGIRNQRPQQDGLACRKIGRVQFAGYATAKTSKPWVRVIGDTPSARWLANQTRDAANIEVTAPRNALDLASTGVARALLPTFIGDQEKGLIRVTSLIPELTHDQWLVTHQDERFKPEVRLTIDRIYELAKALNRKPNTLGA
jgi:DNA-binding transcriptional LysR family regulator